MIVLIGQAPNRHNHEPFDPGHASGRRLMDLMELTEEEFGQIERINLIKRWPGRNGKGDAFPLGHAKRAAKRLLPSLHGKVAFLIGNNVSKAFDWRGELFEFRLHPEWIIWMVNIPHPSRVNRWWNSKRNTRKAKRFFKAVGSWAKYPLTFNLTTINTSMEWCLK